jgi:hypothetical protein
MSPVFVGDLENDSTAQLCLRRHIVSQQFAESMIRNFGRREVQLQLTVEITFNRTDRCAKLVQGMKPAILRDRYRETTRNFLEGTAHA